MWISKTYVGFLVLVSSAAAAAQGAFEFDDIPGIDADPVVAIDMTPGAIGFVRTMVSEFDPGTADILRGLRSIRLRVYNAAENSRQFNNFIDNVTEELEDTNWQRTMFVQNEGTSIRMYMQMNEAEVSGMTALLLNHSEAIFINIDGTISATDLGRVMAVVRASGFAPAMPPVTIPPDPTTPAREADGE